MFLQVCFKVWSFNYWVNIFFSPHCFFKLVSSKYENKQESIQKIIISLFGTDLVTTREDRSHYLCLGGRKKNPEMLSWNDRQTEMSYSLNLSAFMPKHKQGGETIGERETDSQQDGTKQTKNKRKWEGKSIANGIGIRFIPKRQQQKEAGRKAGWFLRPVFPFPWLWKETWHEVEGQAKRRQHCVETVTHRHLFWHAQARLLSVVHANWRAQAVI